MIRFFFRFLAALALAVAVIMAVLDATRTVATAALVMTPLGESWLAASPDTLAAARSFVETRAAPMLWDPVIVAILKLPGFAVFAMLALLLYMAGYRRVRRAGRFAPET